MIAFLAYLYFHISLAVYYNGDVMKMMERIIEFFLGENLIILRRINRYFRISYAFNTLSITISCTY